MQETAKCHFGEETFEWIGMYGYDDHKKQYTAVWVDNSSNAMEIAEGERDSKQKGVSYRGSHYDPRSQKQEPFRWLVAVPETDKLLVEMYSAGKDGKEFRVMEITGTRAK
jgi:hypothetical protein